MHKCVEPSILYWGTPVVLISTLNEDGTPNLAPMSSAWWLDQSCMLGMSSRSRTVNNLLRERECVLNLPSVDLVAAVNRLALTTGSNPVPPHKAAQGYCYVPDKFACAQLTPAVSELVKAPCVVECPVQMEAVIEKVSAFGQPEDHVLAIEARIIRVHVEERLLIPGAKNYIDPEKWSPLIMNFCEFFGLGPKIHPSTLRSIFAPPQEAEMAG
ncbi:flavin reductase [Dictyobacter alpinus]|uniref:Flavin reductase n=1 Tax=Dictyobacter alpinus TaxID=2014873 RepID=A0A402BKD4_9CHLR|nr:flavin reductase family protein [Dictyobacter alpinus]GCE31818.1 flavin reductase [Dictyobacter alpinus]